MSPILIRPVREQIEHDRIIRVLQARLRKEFAVEANLGDERRVPVRVGEQVFYPDLVLTAMGTSKKVQTIIEVETTESVNHLEAMAEWAHYGKARAPFHLYVPAGLVDIARRLIENYHITVAQLWSYSPVGDQVHFWLVSGNGDGSIITSVTDSISAAEPVRPALPEAAPAAEPGTAELPEGEGAPAPAEPARGAAKPAAPAKPAAKLAPAPKSGKAAAPAPRAEPVAKAATPVAKASAKTKPAPARAAKGPARPAAKPAKKTAAKAPAKVARKAVAPKKAARPVPKAAAGRKPAAKPASRAAARRKPAAKPSATRRR